jgi:diguanylate cyclase (GGDEF)-like protein
MSFTDVTTEHELQLHLTRLAECDPLTGLKNRRSFEEALRDHLARYRQDGGHGALLTLDIDRFKRINDSRGHLAGDDVLRALAEALQDHLREGDVAGRLGGDEFALLLADTDEAQAREIGRRVVRDIRAAVHHALDGLPIDVTFGFAALTADDEQAERVLDASDRDMYRGKKHAGPDTGLPVPDAALVDDPEEELSQALSALYATVLACDGYTASHSRDVVLLARAVATELGLDATAVTEVEHVALIHDVGKIAIPDSILHKPGPLTADEQTMMRQHPVIGAQIVGSVAGLRHLAPAIRAEHERWDGYGYPDGLAAEEIPLASRVVFVCDALHAMTTDRPYRPAMPLARARAELERHAGTQFCPEATAALLRVLDARATGEAVTATADRVPRPRELTASP